MIDRPQAARRLYDALLGPGATRAAVRDAILAVRATPLVGLIVEAWQLEFAHDLLDGTPTHTVGIANYPLPGATPDFVCEAVGWCCAHAADEILVGVPVGLLRSGRSDDVRRLCHRVMEIMDGRRLWAAIPAGQMAAEEIAAACRLLADCGVGGVKAGAGGAVSLDTIALIRREVGGNLVVMVDSNLQGGPGLLAWLEQGADTVCTTVPVELLNSLPECGENDL
jgi:deoxyribose-phosphate aldolase